MAGVLRRWDFLTWRDEHRRLEQARNVFVNSGKGYVAFKARRVKPKHAANIDKPSGPTALTDVGEQKNGSPPFALI